MKKIFLLIFIVFSLNMIYAETMKGELQKNIGMRVKIYYKNVNSGGDADHSGVIESVMDDYIVLKEAKIGKFYILISEIRAFYIYNK
ncbi:MAG: hypothetical protein A2086_14320 [Spirochaetes bacterium GWD1_27_9]|nr:MAG: hypothetical protein A2Y34_00575 [Spirochaetes bacterium GWC1_27_15]OHD41233.1 MAG: hypothetical protein A2086_14320 [Spirochaetes bacterium GWD1_27_9]